MWTRKCRAASNGSWSALWPAFSTRPTSCLQQTNDDKTIGLYDHTQGRPGSAASLTQDRRTHTAGALPARARPADFREAGELAAYRIIQAARGLQQDFIAHRRTEKTRRGGPLQREPCSRRGVRRQGSERKSHYRNAEH